MDRDPATLYLHLITDEWWGDGDSIATVDIAIDGGFTLEARQDGQTLHAALVEIVHYLRQTGHTEERAELVARQYRKWLSSGM